MEWYWLALISAVLSALAAILQKKVLFGISALRFSLIVSLFIALFSSLLLKYAAFDKVNFASLTVLFIKSIINASAFLCIMISLKHLELSRTLPVLASSPMIVALLAFIFLGESLSITEVAGMTLIVSGTYILELKKDENLINPFRIFVQSKYHRIILTALLLMSVTSILDKLLLTKFKLPPITFLVIQNYFFMILFFIIWKVNRINNNQEKLFSGLQLNIVLTIILIAVVTIGYRWTQIESTKLAPVGLVISLKRLSVLFAVVIGAKLFKEENYFRKVIATIFIVSGALLIYED